MCVKVAVVAYPAVRRGVRRSGRRDSAQSVDEGTARMYVAMERADLAFITHTKPDDEPARSEIHRLHTYKHRVPDHHRVD